VLPTHDLRQLILASIDFLTLVAFVEDPDRRPKVAIPLILDKIALT
jgi:hypothetical protein